MSTNLNLDSIRTDGGTQPRAGVDYDAVDDYTEEMKAGTKFPAIVVFFDGAVYWLADGFHRYKAAEQAGFTEIACEVHQGTQQDAQWYSFGANKRNGLRRTNEDKQRAVKAALVHSNSRGLSDGQIAKHVGVDQKTVTNWRHQLEATQEIPESPSRKSRDGRTINTAKIGTTRAAIRNEWRTRVLRACMEIESCPVHPKRLARLIASIEKDVFNHLEKANEILTATLGSRQ